MFNVSNCLVPGVLFLAGFVSANSKDDSAFHI